MFKTRREIIALSATSAILGFAVVGAAHFAMSWFAFGPLGAIAFGAFSILFLFLSLSVDSK